MGKLRNNPDFERDIGLASQEDDPARAARLFGALLGRATHDKEVAVLYDSATGEPIQFEWQPVYNKGWADLGPWEGKLPNESKLVGWLKGRLPEDQMTLLSGFVIRHVPRHVEEGTDMGHPCTWPYPAYFRIEQPVTV